MDTDYTEINTLSSSPNVHSGNNNLMLMIPMAKIEETEKTEGCIITNLDKRL